MLPQDRTGIKPAAELLQGALDLVERGYKVFPSDSDKRPNTAHGFYGATDDPDVVRQWAREGRLEHASIATGLASGVVVTDADDEEARDYMIAHYGPPQAWTKRGGHWYWKTPGDKVTTTPIGANGRKLVPGKADSKGDGGYVIAPPSPGKTWTGEIPDRHALRTIPLELVPPLRASSSGGEKLPTEVFDSVVEALAENYPPESVRHDAGLPLVGLLADCGVSEEQARDVIVAARERLPKPVSAKTLSSIEGAVRTTFQRKANGETYTGGHTLDEFVDGLASRLRVALGKEGAPGHMLLTDMGNAERFAKQHGSKIRWVPKFNQWASWDGRRWKLDEGGAAVRLAKETARKLFFEAGREPKKAERDKVVTHAVASQYASRIEAMIRLAKSDLEIEPEMLDSDPWLLNVANGTLDLRTGELSEHDPADLITKLAPVEYDPNAKAPRFERFLQETLVKPALIRYIQQFSGYTLTGSVRERVMSVLHGGGKNGKSTLTELFQDLLGDYSATVDVEVLLAQRYASGTASYSLAVLAGARYVSTAEVGENRQLAEARVKAITGGDKIDARAPYGKPFSYSPQFKLWLSTNDKPTIRGRDDAIWDRVKLTPFEQRFEGENADTTLPVKLRDELPGVLAWMVRGCLDWLENGLIEPDEVTAATQGYRDEMDTFAEFFDEECFVKENAKVRAGVLWDAWVEYLRSTGEHNPGQKSKFNAQVEGRGGTRKRGKGGWMWHDVGLYGDWNRPEGSAAPDFDDGAPDVPQTPKKSKFSQDPPRIGKFEESGASGTSGTPEAEKIAPPPCPDRTHKSIAEPTPGEEPRRKKPYLEIQGGQAACKHPKAARRRGPDGGYTACGKCGALELPEVY